MASEDLINALSPGIGHQTEEDGTIIQDHAEPTVFSDLMGRLLDQFLTGYSERSKNEENKESVTILNERFVGCNGKKGEAAESEVSMAGSDQNESNSIDDQTVEQGTGWLREEAKGCNENEDGISLLKTENFKNEVQSRRIAMEEEVQRRILDSMVNWFLREEEIADNENKEEEEEEDEEEEDEDKYSLHQEILLYIQNWPGCKETKVDNEEILDEGFVGCNGKNEEAAESGVSMAGSDQNESNSIDDQTVEQGTGWLCEEAKGCNENEDGVSLLKTENFKNEVQSRRIAMEEEVQRRILDSMVNWFLREEEIVDNENKEEEEEDEGEYSLHQEILLYIQNWAGCKETNVDNEEILDEGFVGCNGKNEEAAESGVSMAESDQGFKDEDCKLNEAISIDNPIAMEDEVQVQRRLRDSMANWFLREEELVDNHMETLLSLGNWHGGKEKKINNENVGSLAETEGFKKKEVDEIVEQGTGWACEFSRRIAREAEVQRRLQDSMVNWFLREEELVDKENKKGAAAESGVSMAGIDQGGFKNEDCKLNEANLIDDHIVEKGTGWAREFSFVESEVQSWRIAREAEVQRRLLDSMVNWFLREEELVDNENKEEEEEEEDDKYSQHMEILLSLDNENAVSLAETKSFKKEEVEEIQESNDLVLENVAVREEEKVDNGNEFEDQRILMHSLVNWFLCKESNFHKEKEEEDNDIQHRKILLSLGNWHGCKEEKVDNENEETEGRIATDDYSVEKGDNGNEFEDQRILMHSLVNWFLCKETNFHKEKEEEEEKEEEDNDIQHRKILLSLGNWHGCKEEKVDNENEETEGRIATDDYSVEKGDNEEEEEDGVSLQRRIPDSIVNCHGCEEEKVDSEKEEEEGREIQINEKVSENASMLNQITKDLNDIEFALKNENDASAPGMINDAKSEEGAESPESSENEEEEGREIQINEKVSENASMLNQITKDLNDIEFALKNENDASAPGMINDAKSEEGAESPESSEMEVTTETQQENEVKERINCCCCS